MDAQIPPVFYRTSSSLGPLPKKRAGKEDIGGDFRSIPLEKRKNSIESKMILNEDEEQKASKKGDLRRFEEI